MELHERLKYAREKLNISQEEMASIVGLSQTAVSQIENGVRKKANVKYIDELIINHNVNYQWIVHGTGNMLNSKANNKSNTSISKLNEKTNNSEEENLEEEEIFKEEAVEILKDILKKQEENGKNMEKLLDSLKSAYDTIEKLTDRLLDSIDKNTQMGKHKAYSVQPVGYPNSTAVYAYS